MLSPADAHLIRRDPALPDLSLLLNPVAFGERLRADFPQRELGKGRATYVRYKPATSCLVAYRFESPSGPLDLYTKCYRPGENDKLEKAKQRIADSGGEAFGALLQGSAAVVYIFPCDHNLSTLSRMADRSERRRLLVRLLGGHPGLWDADLLTLQYKPERRYVAQLVSRNGQSALLKSYSGRDYESAARSAKVVRSNERLRVARRLGRSARYRTLVLEWLPGVQLTAAIGEADFDLDTIPAVGEALAELHAQTLSKLRRMNRKVAVNSVLATAEGIAYLVPDWAERVRILGARLASYLVCYDGPACPIHNDFSSDQVQITDSGVAILDLDSITYGDPIADLGSFAARLELSVLIGDLSASRAGEVTEALLEAYCATRICPRPARFERNVAVSLLRLASYPFRYRKPNWPQLTKAIIERADILASRLP